MSSAHSVPDTPDAYVSELSIRFGLMGLRAALDDLIRAADRIEPRYRDLAASLRRADRELRQRVNCCLRDNQDPVQVMNSRGL